MRISDKPASTTVASTTVNANSLLELESTSRALLLPRLTQTQIDAMQGVPAGMLVYNSTTNLLNIRSNTSWVTLAQAANAASSTNPWSTSGSTTYTTLSKVGIGTSNPYSQLANNSVNTTGSDGFGGNPGSLSWSADQLGYVGQIYNGRTGSNSNGLVVKVNSTDATALDVGRGLQNGGSTPLLTVKSTGRVGINKNDPTEALEVTGNIKYSGNLLMGVQYIYTQGEVPNSSYVSYLGAACPVGTKLIGGGGGQYVANSTQYNCWVNYSGPNKDDSNIWAINFTNLSGMAVPIRVYAICAKVQ
ncbi:hypothetical protein GCM10028807_51830 [Spirosoma daeguense]